jgi:hypothetical protein
MLSSFVEGRSDEGSSRSAPATSVESTGFGLDAVELTVMTSAVGALLIDRR